MNQDPLLFPVERYTTETRTIDGKEIMLHHYKHLCYVAAPIDDDFQSLNVTVPVSIDGIPVDSSRSPILFIIGVGGYMSCRIKGESKSDGPGPMPGGPGPMPGGPGPMPGGPLPEGPGGPGPIAMPGMPGAESKDLCLQKGFVIVEPGCRGRDNQFPDGRYYGKAPAAIVDLKAAVRYLRHNKGIMPGNPDWIVSTGGSAGGALSALLGASGNSPLYEPYLNAIGAAAERDDILGSCNFSAITNLEHADACYEWEYGNLPQSNPFTGVGDLVDQSLSAQLIQAYKAYQNSLELSRDGFGPITADTMENYLLQYYLIPSANRYLSALSPDEVKAYVEKNPWLTWDGKTASFSFQDFTAHCGRMKGLPAFDDFEMSMAEPIEFGSETVNARHFTEFSIRHTTGDPNAQVEPEVLDLLNLMNPMYFIHAKNPGIAPHWWIRHGACDNHTSLPIITNMADSLRILGKEVNARLVWDGGHCADDDPAGMADWIESISRNAN